MCVVHNWMPWIQKKYLAVTQVEPGAGNPSNPLTSLTQTFKFCRSPRGPELTCCGERIGRWRRASRELDPHVEQQGP